MSENNPVYSTRVSAETLAEQSRKATEEGMRELAAAFAERRNQVIEVSDSDSDSTYTSSCSESSHVRHRKTKQKQSNKWIADKLEERIHYLQLDLVNANVSVDEWRTKAEHANKHIDNYKRVNDEIAFLKSALNRLFKDVWNLTKVQLENKFRLFNEEASEHSSLCNAAIQKIELDEVKIGLLRVLNSERRRHAKLSANFKYLMFAVWIKEWVVFCMCCMSLLVVLFSVGYAIMYNT
jgi:hypothetical protein